MTIKASSQITISKVIDIHACYRYYKLQGSTLAKPTKPTKNPPDGWSDTEPAYISGSTNTLYFVDCNVYSDKSFSFSEVSKSSSYEAAKDAWNKANNAQDTATNAQNKVDNLQVGGRNLFLESGMWTTLPTWWVSNGGGITLDKTVTYAGNYTLKTTVGKGIVGAKTGFIELDPSCVYTYSALIRSVDTEYHGGTISPLHFHCSKDKSDITAGIQIIAYNQTLVANTWSLLYLTFKPNAKYFRPFIYIGNSANCVVNIAYLKLEKGNKATDWTPAPEDIDNRFDAAETRITQAETSIETTNNQIALKASTETVTEIYNRANQLDKALSDALVTINKNRDAIATLTARDFKVQFTTLTNQLTQLNDDYTSYKKKVDNWMRFDADGNLVLGATREEGQDAYELKLTKSRISFMLNDVEVAYISNNELYITDSTVVQNLKIGRFVWEVRGNGNLGLVWR